MKVRIQRLTDNAHVPTQAHSSDFCYDVYATSCEEIEPGIWKYSIGLAYEIERSEIDFQDLGLQWAGTVYTEDSEVKISLDFRPRSSVWKTGLILSNCVGTLDELYRGEILAYFYEVVPGKEKYKVGDRIGQVKLGFTLPIEWEVVDEIDTNTDRGANGFGSSGR